MAVVMLHRMPKEEVPSAASTNAWAHELARQPREAVGAEVRPHLKHEIELTYFVPKTALRDALGDLRKYQPKTIRQYLFDDHHVPDLLKFGEKELGIKIADPALFNRARLRSVGQSEWYLEIKTKKQGHDLIQNGELIVPLKREHFSELVPVANVGFLEKLRHKIPGKVHLEGEVIPIVARVNEVLAAGVNAFRSNDLRDNLQFYLTDVEFSHAAHTAPFRAGHHSFKFLNTDNALELSASDETTRDIFSSKGIAKLGGALARDWQYQMFERLVSLSPTRGVLPMRSRARFGI